MKRYLVDHKRISWANDIELMESGINERLDSARDLDKRVKLFNFGKEMRNLKTRPKSKLLGLLKRYFL
jgi:hypothetical protein